MDGGGCGDRRPLVLSVAEGVWPRCCWVVGCQARRRDWEAVCVDDKAAFAEAGQCPLSRCCGAECGERLCLWVCPLEGWGEGDEGANESR